MKNGHSFFYKHEANNHSITVSADQDLSLEAMFEVFNDYLAACGFSQASIDNYYKELSVV